ncbi:MAG: PepSY-like domain-containing protein [Bacteroidales bacterium]
MKKVVVILVCMLSLQTIVKASDDKSIQVNQLPSTAQDFIKKYFADTKVTYATMDNDLISKDYEVTFANGCKVEFNSKGLWSEVECKTNAVPIAIIPAPIHAYVKKMHADTKLSKIDRDPRGYEVTLSNKMELQFDKAGSFVGYDD